MEINIHKDAQKQLRKAPSKIKKKADKLVGHIIAKGLKNFPFPIKPLKGKFKVYHEILLDDDYRIIYRIENNSFFIRYAGTHNQLKTG